MSLSYYHHVLANNGPTTQLCLMTPGIKVFPIKFNVQKQFTVEKNIVEISIKFDVFVNFEQLVNISYRHAPMLDYESMSINSEVFYEYGNEEEYLPPAHQLTVCYSSAEMFSLLQKKINMVETDENLPLNSLWQKFYQCFLQQMNSVPNDDEISNEMEKVALNMLFTELEQLEDIQSFCQRKLLENS